MRSMHSQVQKEVCKDVLNILQRYRQNPRIVAMELERIMNGPKVSYISSSRIYNNLKNFSYNLSTFLKNSRKSGKITWGILEVTEAEWNQRYSGQADALASQLKFEIDRL